MPLRRLAPSTSASSVDAPRANALSSVLLSGLAVQEKEK